VALYVELDATAAGGENYWEAVYAEGDPTFGAAAVSSNTEQTVVAGYRVQSTGYLTTAESEADCAPYAVRPTGGLSVGTVTTFFGGNYISATGIIPFPQSPCYVFSQLVRTAAFRADGDCTVVVNGRKKWETVDESTDIWTEVTY
jgi:hypothetical protein